MQELAQQVTPGGTPPADGKKTDPYALRPPDNGYRFSVTSELSTLGADPSAVVGPRGTRMQVVYGQTSRIEFLAAKCSVPAVAARPKQDRDHYLDLYQAGPTVKQDRRDKLKAEQEAWLSGGWQGLEGTVLSGGDFLQIRADGVIELDGRVTLRASDDTLIDASYAGLIDLEAFDPAFSLKNPDDQLARVSLAYQRFVGGTFPATNLPLKLFITFDTSTGPWSTENSEDTTWTKPSQLRHRGNVWKYAELVRRQYVGEGEIVFEHTPGSLPKPVRISVDVYDVAVFRGAGK